MNCAGDFFGVFGTYALSSALSYCVGSGVNVAMAGGSFSAGFVGNAHGVASTGFYSGFATGAASGFTSAFITGAGTSWINGSSFADGLLNGLKDGAMNSIIEGIIGGIGGGLDALSKHANFFTGRAKIDLNGAYYFSGYWPPEITTMEVIGRYVGDFEGVHVFESPLIGNIKTNWRACTIPEVGIFAVRGALTSMTKELEESGMALLQHEFGHILQYRGWKKAYWPLVAKESFISAKSHNSTHHKFWTETWANYLSKEYFGERWLGTYTRFKKWYPAVNISPENLKRVESF